MFIGTTKKQKMTAKSKETELLRQLRKMKIYFAIFCPNSVQVGALALENEDPLPAKRKNNNKTEAFFFDNSKK